MGVMRHEAVMEQGEMVRCSCGSEFDNKQDWEAHVENAYEEDSRKASSANAIDFRSDSEVQYAMKVLAENDFRGIRHLETTDTYEEYIVIRAWNEATPFAVHRMLIRNDGQVLFEQGDYYEIDREHEAWERFYKRG